MSATSNAVPSCELLGSTTGLDFQDDALAAQLLSVRDLLQFMAESMCAEQVDKVGEAGSNIIMLARQMSEARPDLQSMSPAHAAVAPGEELRRAVLSLIEARAFCLTVLRRWRRAMHLRRSSLQLKHGSDGYGEELTGWS